MRVRDLLLAYWFICAYGYISDAVPEDYIKLVDYANIATIAYCLKKGLERGLLSDEGTSCMLEICKHKPYGGIEVKGTFDFNSWGSVCSGYYALDHENQRILLAFRGTASRKDWIRNMDIIPVKYEPLSINRISTKAAGECDNCKVHQGYYNILKKNCLLVIQTVADLKEEYSNYKLAIVGHSLGGALAILSGIEFQLMGYDPLVISYASPKVGNKFMVEYIDTIFSTSEVAEYIFENRDFNTGLIRVVHKGDIVTKLPPTKLYRHCGFEYFINKSYTPHTPDHVIPKGTSFHGEISTEEQISTASINSNKSWSKKFSKYDHTHYFRWITKCDLK